MLAHRIPDPMSDDLTDHALKVLAHAVGITSQIVMDEEPVPFQQWPQDEQWKARRAARVAVRWPVDRIRQHCRLHARRALAVVKYDRRYQDLHAIQQNAVNREVDAVLNTFIGRLEDYRFDYLGGDVVRELTPERKAS